ncbi:DUF4268 domain-containing protein [Parabacteroides sp. PF5-9]|uniref:DUF4268 domain-containing protein n=1 Tax=Parabacteroides sp. PF5-9 TaxID=1742404 RepID=UPI002473C15A|nr:DUF4268 domain-containing protein [Parabacteroides sp. PF5-9]MDH6358324.1 hypothetical protein [Parabacteroides sp. PF5-9]
MYSKEELKNLKTEFWESFAAYCEVQPYLRGRKKIWVLYNTKVKAVELKFDIVRKKTMVMIEVNHRQEDSRLEMVEKLTWYKETLERDLENELIWDICYRRETGQEVARIYILKEGADLHRREDWGELFAFMAQKMYLLERNFLEIAAYLKE